MSPIRLGARMRRAGRIGLPLLTTAAVLAAAGPASAEPTTVRFDTGAGCTVADWSVPPGVTEVDVTAQGATGESVGDFAGDTGVQVSTTVPVTAGQTPRICIDAGGGAAGNASGGPGLAGGRGGGYAAVR